GFLCSAPSRRRPIKAIRQRWGSCAALGARGEQSLSPAPSSSISSAVPQNGTVSLLSLVLAPLPWGSVPWKKSRSIVSTQVVPCTSISTSQFQLENIRVQSERITQLKEAVKQLGHSAALLDKGPCSPRREKHSTSTTVTPGIQRDEQPLTFTLLPLLLGWIAEPIGACG
ncbi:hypothetical protein KUCAC02_012194, partial [Chaenocephalus aceratus]